MKTHHEINVWLSDSEIEPASVERIVASSDGALVSFKGIVRDNTEGKEVVALDYEAYSEMAENEMRRIAEEACSRWDIGSVAIVHRTGSLAVGDVSVVVAVSSPHRGEAFDACEFCIDTLKESVPIWKKERFGDGTSSWVNHP